LISNISSVTRAKNPLEAKALPRFTQSVIVTIHASTQRLFGRKRVTRSEQAGKVSHVVNSPWFRIPRALK
jgi:hypothetical protein